jgi:hypothetical protein
MLRIPSFREVRDSREPRAGRAKLFPKPANAFSCMHRGCCSLLRVALVLRKGEARNRSLRRVGRLQQRQGLVIAMETAFEPAATSTEFLA